MKTTTIQNAPERTLIRVNGQIVRTGNYTDGGRMCDFAPGEIDPKSKFVPYYTPVDVFDNQAELDAAR